MRYRGSVEDRVHQLLSERLGNIRNMFGQLPDTLEDVWVAAALRDEEEAKRVIDAVPKRHPFKCVTTGLKTWTGSRTAGYWVRPANWRRCGRGGKLQKNETDMGYAPEKHR